MAHTVYLPVEEESGYINTMRCFIAIDIDEGIRNQIDRLQNELRQKTGLTRPDVKWTEPDPVSYTHLTLPTN